MDEPPDPGPNPKRAERAAEHVRRLRAVGAALAALAIGFAGGQFALGEACAVEDDTEPAVSHVVRFVVEGRTVATRRVAAGASLGRLPTAPTTSITRGSVFLRWRLPDGKAAKAATVVTRDVRVRAVVAKEPKPAKLLDKCAAGSWGRDQATGDRWVCFRRVKVDKPLATILPHVENDLVKAGVLEPGTTLDGWFGQGAYHRG